MEMLIQILNAVLGIGWQWLALVDLLLLLALGFFAAPLWCWTVWAAWCLAGIGAGEKTWILFAAFALVLNIPALRRVLMTWPIFKIARRLMPGISETEKTALEAGEVWVEKDLFSGRPDMKKLLRQDAGGLTSEERAFLDGPVEEVCSMVNDWETWERQDLSAEVWKFLKEKGFFGMIVPREYGGLGFSASAHSEVILKLSSRSLPLGITVMVPNALGPAELLIHYGTEDQKKHYLPRLARGEEIPCFSLTEPLAGSDAGSIAASGVLFKGEGGRLSIRLDWNKRYITLAAVSTVIGLAFKLKDPEHLLGDREELGITCALVPAGLPGVVLGERHDAMGVPFFNCPTRGHDVVVPVESIVGGADGIGRGWKMLMECLAAGRGISLPAQSTGCLKMLSLVVSAYSVVRKQFGISIGKFEGIAAPLARIGALTYLVEAARRYTLVALDQGKKPPVISAIMKYHSTEMARKLFNDGMDILGGAGISRGPRNLVAHTYIALPIAITVEGANILTRSLIIFGQAAWRAHPYAYREMAALDAGNLAAFDLALWGHVGHIASSALRAFLLSISRGHLAMTGGREIARYSQKLAWASASFAWIANLAMASLGGKLKLKEHLTGRLADILSWMFLGVAVLRRYEREGRKKEDLPFVHWSMQYALAEIQNAVDGILKNLPIPILGRLVSRPLLLWHRLNPLGNMPCDALTNSVASLMQTPGAQRERLAGNIYLPKGEGESFARLERAFALVCATDPVMRKVKKALKDGALLKQPQQDMYRQALEREIISREEFDLLSTAEKACHESIQVDSFALDI